MSGAHYPLEPHGAFFDPLPPPLDVGLPNLDDSRGGRKHRHRAQEPSEACLEHLEDCVEKLAKVAGVDHKAHMKSIVLKRPSARLLKRPAAAAVPVAKVAKVAKVPVLDAHSALVKKCIDFIEGSVTKESTHARQDDADNLATVYSSVQRDIFVALIKVKRPKTKTVCICTGVQFGSKTQALAAAAVLRDLWNVGATAVHLQMVKNSGLLFGCKCGKIVEVS